MIWIVLPILFVHAGNVDFELVSKLATQLGFDLSGLLARPA